MKRNIFIKICILFLIFPIISLSQSQQLIHFEKAQAQFSENKDEKAFEQYKQCLADYYLNGNYEKDVLLACNQAINHFEFLVHCDSNSAIIFDIDDTAVYHFQTYNDFRFIWTQSWLSSLTNFDAPAIKPVLHLYQYLLKKGYKIIFMSGRGTEIKDITIKQLHAAGYKDYELLILCPYDTEKITNLSQWKLKMRKSLATIYTIVGCVADRQVDFEGGFTGHQVKLPNYLY